MIDTHDFEDDDFEFEEEDFILRKRVSEMNEGELLQRFKRFFDSSSRAMLQDCRFRIEYHEDGKGTLEILCPNEVVRQRLSKKTRKINNQISSCWLHIKSFSLCVEENGELVCHTFVRGG
ncbi:MAG: hypothetical protein KME31_06455 [Tolypothrix carrinoi HA7290-LM1]|jgi:hypothetical protein|nr:hypothetical protein [Tolypothrix carrinoi HA7290-LM1]